MRHRQWSYARKKCKQILSDVERNTVLRPKDALSPLFEAVMNAVDRFEKLPETSGNISIVIERGQASQHQLFGLPIRSL